MSIIRESFRQMILATIIAMAVMTTLIIGCAPTFAAESGGGGANLECTYLSGTNINYQDYSRWSRPVYSYLTKAGDQYMRVQGNTSEDGIAVAYYDKNFKLVKRQTVKEELPMFGAFYETEGNYYIVSGQKNPEEADTTEVVRLTKYDKEWNRLSSCSLFGANTYIPFDAGSCRMDVSGDKMVIHTCHEMYDSGDGVHHQSNLTILVDLAQMLVLDKRVGVSNSSTGYVSHSFNQFVHIDDNHIVTVDHGDAYPRGIALIKSSKDLSKNSVNGFANTVKIALPFTGKTGDNTTGASAGGFEVSSSSYLIAGNSVVQDENSTTRKTRNVFVAAVDKGTFEVTTNWLTSYEEGETTTTTPQLVKTGSDTYMILWSREGKVCYATMDGSGQKTSEVFSVKGTLSDCHPIVDNGNVVWYSWKDGDEKFYRIPLSSLKDAAVTEVVLGHDHQHVKTENGLATMRCSKCGDEYTAKVPTSFFAYWRDTASESYTYYSSMPAGIGAGGAIEYLISNLGYSAESDKSLTDFTVKATPSDSCVVDTDEEKITFNAAGEYTITVYPTYNPTLKKQYSIKIVKSLSEVTVTAAPDSPQEIGSTVRLSTSLDGGKGKLTYSFIQIDADKKETVLAQDQSAATLDWTPEKAGTYQIRVDVKDAGDNDKVVSSTPITYVFSKKAQPQVLPPATFNVAYSVDKVTADILANTPNWTFAAEDLGKSLTAGETVTVTAVYVGTDAENYETTSAQVKITRSACGHPTTHLVGEQAADCENDGWSGDVYCDECKAMVQSGHIIPALDHDWQKPAYTWAEDNTSATARRVCSRDASHVETETQKSSAEITKAPTYTTRGETTYTVTFTNPAFAPQTRTVADIPALQKLDNPMTASGKTIKAKAKKKTAVKAAKAFKVTNAEGSVTYKKLKGNKKISVSKTGKVTVKKGLEKKKNYKVKVRVTAAGNEAYEMKSVDVTLKVKIK